MAKLPDFTALGQAPSSRSGRGVVGLPAPDLGAEYKARGLKSIGGTLSAIGEQEAREQDSLDAIRADAHYKKAMLDGERTFDNDPDYPTYDLRFGVLSNTITEDASNLIRNPKLREKFVLQKGVESAGVRDRILSKGDALARQAKLVEVEKSLGTYQSIYTDPTADDKRRSQSMADMEAVITVAERGGLVDPQGAQKLRDSFIRGTIRSDVETRMASDPEGLSLDLNGTPTLKPIGAPDVSGAIEPGNIDLAARPVVKNKDGSISTVRSTSVNIDGQEVLIPTVSEDGKVLSVDEAVKQYQKTGRHLGKFRTPDEATAYAKELHDYQDALYSKRPTSEGGLEFIRGQEGFTPQAKPDGRQHSNGFGTKAKSPNEVITREEAERRLLAETGKVSDWIDRNIKVPLTQRQKDALVSFGFNLGTDDLDKLKGDINAGNFERVAERMLTFNQFEGKSLEGLIRRRQQEAQMFLNSGPAPRYALLTPEERAKYGREASRARDTAQQSRLWDFKQQLADDVESRRTTGVGRENLELDAIKRTVEPSVWNSYVNQSREADLEFEAGRDLNAMPTDAMRGHLDGLVPEPGAPDYEMKATVYDKVKARADKIRELREKDPAASVNDLPEVKKASQDYNAQAEEGGADFGKVISARLEAQRRVGIPSYDQSPITKAEGQALLDLPSNTSGLPEKEYLSRLRAAADRAEQQYGPLMARKVFESAVRFHIRDKTGSDAAAGIVSKMVKGEAVTQDDYRRMNELQSIDLVGRTFDASVRPDMGDEDRPYVSPLHAAGEKAFVSEYAAEEAARVPNPAQVEWLKSNPDAWQAFDLKFGRGAAARALGQKPKTQK